MTDDVETWAHQWRWTLAVADQNRDRLIEAVRSASVAGVSEYALASAAGVSRQTIRAWLGKGRP